MAAVDQLAEAALAGDALRLRSVTQDWLRQTPRLSDVAPPQSTDPTLRAIAAALVELLAGRQGASPPDWTRHIGAAPHPTHLVRSAQSMPRLRRLCEEESPLPLRRRNLFAPPTFLEFA